MGKVAILEKDVIQGNPLIEARKKMSVTELRLFVLGLQDVKPHITDGVAHDVNFHETRIPYSELVELFGKDYNGNITNLKRKVESAAQCVIELSSKNGGFGFASIYRKIRYEPDIGLIIHFNDELKPYILDLVNQAYTRYKVKALFSLSSAYAWRILELLLKQQGYFKLGHKEVYVYVTMDELRFYLNVPDGLYKNRIDNLRLRVLDEPIKEINEKTDYYVWYNVIKTGRKVTGFKLWMRYKDNAALEVEEELPALPEPQVEGISKTELAKEMLAEGMPNAAINTWLKRYGVDGAAASWRLAVEHADGRTETHGKGTQRKKYLKACMERNIAQMNADDERIKAEIDSREKRLAEEKKRHQKEDLEAIGNLGISVERYGSEMQSAGSLLGADAPRRSIDEIVKDNPSLAGLARLKKKAMHGEPQEDKTKTVEEQLEEHGQQRLFEDEEPEDDGNIFSDGSKESFKSEFAKIMRLECSNDEKLKKILSIEGDDESGNLLKMMALLIETSGKINTGKLRGINLQERVE